MLNQTTAEKRYLPMTETMCYILLSLQQERHGYGIMQHVQQLTAGRITLGAGTIYQSLAKLESDGLIRCVKEEDRKKLYQSTPLGVTILSLETARIRQLYNNLEAIR